ncbi:MAG: HDIG domain-containing protein [Firmicutes bacterium]|nr:HDIG domain-containing protein [Bacillota bacterium]MCL5039369.1 HDIG domain-containing protein [Bacillota bacterium]
MNRQEALGLVREKVVNRNLVNHMLAVEAIMRRLARHFGEDEERWGMAGLLHDVDYEMTKDDPERHSLVSGQMVQDLGFDVEIVEAVKAHNERHGLPRTTLMSKALYSCDPLSGLIVAAALIRPEKKLAPVDAKFVLNRFGEKSFAKGANREIIKSCSELGLSLEEFLGLGLEAMQGIAGSIGL